MMRRARDQEPSALGTAAGLSDEEQSALGAAAGLSDEEQSALGAAAAVSQMHQEDEPGQFQVSRGQGIIEVWYDRVSADGLQILLVLSKCCPASQPRDCNDTMET